MIRKNLLIFFIVVSLALGMPGKTKKTKKDDDPIKSSFLNAFKFRSIGPSFTSGRIADIAVNPKNQSEFYIGAASGNIWKTTNNGVTFKPVFDKYGSYSIGCLAIDPKNPNVVWAGTGENNHQRALGYGDGIYKTLDGGKSWKNMGLKNSRQIGMILIDPRNTDVVYVAAEGSAWGPGGDRGLFKTSDGGKSWKKILNVSKNTGINCAVMDPDNPDIIIASSEQRRRHVFTKIGGGPETAIYKTTDAGKSWKKLKSGLPKAHMGGIGLAMSPVNPLVVYAIIEAAENQGGFFRSTDQGESWKKMSIHRASGQYYNEIYCDPKNVNKVISVETVTHYTMDGGKTWSRMGLKNKHVDDHVAWIDPSDTNHIMIGGDGGVYYTYDMGKNWNHFTNIPATQFYRVFADNSKPFYYVYGGTQDNSSMGGPSNTTNSGGIPNSEWFITNGGDGFWSAVDWKDPNIVYAESQYGGMVRYDRRSGERKYIRPQPEKGEKTYKWNWNTPLIISSHLNTRIYCAANFVFRSDDRGESWKTISPDLTAGIDRNSWKVMGKYWGAESVKKDVSTSLFGMVVSLGESILDENILIAGTDDGLIQVTDNGGKSWRKISSFPGVPMYTYVSDVMASRFDKNTVYATFDNRKRDDFKPYILVSNDMGKTWKSLASNLPANGTIHTIAQDHVKKELLFAGTEFGIFCSLDGGKKWRKMKSGIPTIAVRDIAIQRDENDLAIATFGRGFYILDDYSPLRELSTASIKNNGHIFNARDGLLFIQSRKKYGQGETFWTAKNRDYGVTFTYYLKNSYKTDRQKRIEKDSKLFKTGSKIRVPGWEELRSESMEIPPHLVFTIKDINGNIITKIYKKASKGVHRMTWDLSMPFENPVKPKGDKFDPFKKIEDGFPVMAGEYSIDMSVVAKGISTKLAGPVKFRARSLKNATLRAKDQSVLNNFHRKLTKLSKVLQGNFSALNELKKKINIIKQTLYATPSAPVELFNSAIKIEKKLNKIDFLIRGLKPKASREEIPPTHPPILTRFRSLLYSQYATTSAPGKSQLNGYKLVVEELRPLIRELKEISEKEIRVLEKKLDSLKAPWTPGRILDLD